MAIMELPEVNEVFEELAYHMRNVTASLDSMGRTFDAMIADWVTSHAAEIQMTQQALRESLKKHMEEHGCGWLDAMAEIENA